jgi:hypothetical protein
MVYLCGAPSGWSGCLGTGNEDEAQCRDCAQRQQCGIKFFDHLSLLSWIYVEKIIAWSYFLNVSFDDLIGSVYRLFS